MKSIRPGMRKHKLKARPIEQMRQPVAAIGGFFAFARPENWFVSKIPPLLAVAYLEILRFGIAPDDAARLLACSLFSIFVLRSMATS